MSDEAGLLGAIQSAPFDDFPLEVYADWLDERGDERGDYLRTIILLDNAGDVEAFRPQLVDEERRFRLRCPRDWLDDISSASVRSFWTEWEELTTSSNEVAPAERRRCLRRCLRNLMRRARLCVETLFERLKASGYLFVYPETAHQLPYPESLDVITQFEAKSGLFLPASLKSWLDEVGVVNFMGTHPEWPQTAYCFSHAERDRPAWRTDPLVVDYCLDDLVFRLQDDSRSTTLRSRFLAIAPDAEMKANLLGEVASGVLLTDTPRFDGPCTPLSDSLMHVWRNALRWGGFPGFANYGNRPHVMLEELCDGLPNWE